jgi:anti-sigma factor RsiW
VSIEVKIMTCDEAKSLLVSLADGCLSKLEAEAVEEHVAGCANCRQELELLKSDAALLRQEPKPEVPAWLATRIMAEVREHQSRHQPRYRLNLVLASTAAVVLVLVGIWLGTVLGRGIVGNQPRLDQRLAAVGLHLPAEGGR